MVAPPQTQLVGTPMAAMITPVVSIGSVVAYLAIIKLTIVLMKNKQAYECTNAMRVYNLAQVILCAYMCWGLYQNPFSNFFRLNTGYSASDEWFVWVHYISKWLDFFDTLFMALRKRDRQITTLHVFHHASIPLIWSLLMNVGYAWGTCTLGALFNSLIHVIMYSHYFVTSFGIDNPFKKLVTLSQLSQFAVLIVHSLVVLVFESTYSRNLAYLQTAYQAIMFSMFFSFYTKSYGKAEKGEKKSKKEA